MAVLTWRNVDTPDFRGSLDGYRTAGALLRGAAGTWNDQIAFDQDRAANELLQAQRQEQLSQLQYANNRTRNGDARMDAATPDIQALVIAARNGDPAAQAQLLKTPGMTGLRADQFISAAATADKFTSSGQDIRGTDQTQNWTKYGHDRTMKNNADVDAVNAVIPGIIRNAGSASDALGMAEKAMGNLTPEGQSMLMKEINARFPGTYGPVDAATTPTAPAAGAKPGSASAPGSGLNARGENVYDTVLGFGQFGKPAKPVSSMTIGETVKFGKDVLIPNTKGNSQLGLGAKEGSSAVGAFQFTGETLEQYGPKVLGPNWREEKLTPENQDKLAEALFNDRKNDNLKKTWTSLPDATPGAYKNMPWAEARKLIVQGETGGSLTDMPSVGERRAAGLMVASATSDQTNAGIVADIDAARKSTETNVEVARRLQQSDIKGWSDKEAVAAIDKIISKTGATPAVAGAILRRSLGAPTEGNEWYDKYIPWTSKNVSVNESRLNENMVQYNNGGTDRAELTVADTKDYGEKLATLETKAQDKRAKYNSYKARVDAGQTGLAQYLPKLEEERDEAVRNLNLELAAQRTNPLRNPDRVGQAAAKKAKADQPAANKDVDASDDSVAGSLKKSAKDAYKVVKSGVNDYQD